MLLLHVQIRVKPEFIEAFKAATIANARESLREEAVARFDLVQVAGDPSRFLLLEAYRTPDGHAAHRETRHYALWRDTVAPMMAENRTLTRFATLFPEDAAW